MQSEEIREKFLKFFEKRGHKIIPSASLVPENDPSVLFNTAGMQPLVPYLMGEKHPMGTRLANVQKCVRTVDLEDIGDNRHFSFFEMMGNWSLGDYFKKEAIQWSYEFLTSKEEGLGLDPRRLYITVFEGDENAPQDVESAQIWQDLGIPVDRVYFLGADDNWWSAGDDGPCGPDTEMFYDMSGSVGNLNNEEFLQAVKKEEVVEIWNDVFMEYEKRDGKVIGKLKQKNVDTGAGLERITAVMQGKNTAYDTDLFEDFFKTLTFSGSLLDERSKRIIADHVRAAVFIISDGVMPSNNGRGYVLRRLLRRAIYQAGIQGKIAGSSNLSSLVDIVARKYKNFYPEILENISKIRSIFHDEEVRFSKTLENGLKEFKKGADPFVLFTTYGFPIELTEELAKEGGIKVDREDFNRKMAEHQKLSQTTSAGMFKGGLVNHEPKTIRHHTAHHLMLAALQDILGPQVKQRGSNISEERLRMDFVCDRKLSDEEKKKVEEWVNDKIERKLEVVRREMPFEEAEKIGAQMEFGVKYGDVVTVYFIEDEKGNVFSKEFCGGPHVKNTAELSQFKILKEEAVSKGIRRIKAALK